MIVASRKENKESEEDSLKHRWREKHKHKVKREKSPVPRCVRQDVEEEANH